MNTRLLMITSAFIMGIVGILLSFIPQETATFLGWPPGTSLSLQIIGALYFGFAMVNWIAKSQPIGGIYGRPISIGNFTHYFIAAIALIKLNIKGGSGTTMIIVTIVYSVFTLLFAFVAFTHPFRVNRSAKF